MRPQLAIRLLTSPQGIEALELSEQQVADLRQYAEKNREDLIALRGELQEAQQGLRALIESDNPDTDTIMARVEEIGRIQTEQHKLQVSQELGMRRILTPQQREKAVELLRERAGQIREDRPAGERPVMDRMRADQRGIEGRPGPPPRDEMDEPGLGPIEPRP